MNVFKNEELERIADKWALEHIRSETDAVEAAKKFYILRTTFIKSYNTEKSKSENEQSK